MPSSRECTISECILSSSSWASVPASGLQSTSSLQPDRSWTWWPHTLSYSPSRGRLWWCCPLIAAAARGGGGYLFHRSCSVQGHGELTRACIGHACSMCGAACASSSVQVPRFLVQHVCCMHIDQPVLQSLVNLEQYGLKLTKHVFHFFLHASSMKLSVKASKLGQWVLGIRVQSVQPLVTHGTANEVDDTEYRGLDDIWNQV